MAEGWIKLHRSIRKNWIWEDAQKLKWWLDILLQANHKDNKILLGNELLNVERGSFHTSEIKLSNRWNVDRKTVRRFLELLQKDNMISIEKSKKGTTIKISNYNDFQDFLTDEKDNARDNKVPTQGTTGGTDKSHISPNKGDTNNNDKELYKNDKEGKEGEEVPPHPHSIPSKPTEIESIIIDQFTKETYITWFSSCEFEINEKEVKIKVPNNFTKTIIENKYKEPLRLLTGKEIILEG